MAHDPSVIIVRKTLDALKALQAPGEPNILVELIDAFLLSATPDVAKASDFLKQNDISRAGKVAHGLKSAAQSLGAENFGALCGELERLGHTGNLQPAPALMMQIKNEYTLVQSELERIKAELSFKAA